MPDPITRDELRAKIERGDAFHLFEVLAPMYWRKHHLPGAVNLPPAEVRERIVELVPDRRAEIVVYCWDDG
ncbi:MAG TPA: rhodanese-like domain-containing protein [Gemmatimonadaceae bacterium]|nr:rhodanese-like domain-containing protein [Gemmatimonadaceae bacterium]